MTNLRFSHLLFLLSAFAVTMAGCDVAGTGDTITLSTSANTELEPIEYTFQYTPTEAEDGSVLLTVAPNAEPNLDEMLNEVAATSRSKIQSASVERVTLRRVTSGGTSAAAAPASSKVFRYLSRVEVRLGGESGPVIAANQPVPVPDGNSTVDMALGSLGEDANSVDVTGPLKNKRPTPATLDLQVSNPDEVGNPFDKIEIAIYYSIEVPV